MATLKHPRLATGGLAALAALAVLGTATPALACGVSATGVASCSLAEHREGAGPRWALGVGGVYTSTALRFSDSLRVEQTRGAALAELVYSPLPRLGLELGLGATFGGSLVAPDGTHTFSPGPSALLGAVYRVVDAPVYFLQLTSALSFSTAQSQLAAESPVGYTAVDLRLGGELGLNLVKVLHPYVLGRVFGGPVFWRYQGEAVTGTDIHHYQLGAGLGVQLGTRVSLFVEGVPLGERALGGGASFAL